ncbi:SM-20 protein [Vibrio navarrensis]|uniref:2OG-Fe(II) oxygenase n=1 Tax=Vibrio navarrensis TaxID=29495 RepID=A0AAJ4LV41_9VIBR|nr:MULTISPECIES: 2OG-Fe(II) oxygenase [Vibrio]KJR24870.1 SM-20 protein [Vibrio sp. S234-5]MBE3651067.1 SM-20 protein [Vibrio navarrensis]MBE3655479.1 SM-20 protein [Vibrio navarrensis]MBE3659475.1 SM-20 protein [Vibrio navarrensis]MBE3667605.1 SM-20 protein [Vibrio navarrensis]
MDPLIDALITQGYFIWDDFLESEEVLRLRDAIPEKWKEARIGRNDDLIKVERIRSDKIQWLQAGKSQAVDEYLAKMEEIRLAVNRYLYLGLFEYEAHFAKYEQGDFYQKHLDSFRGQENRKLTTVFYLNDTWQEGNGGELVMYDLQDQHLQTVQPKGGRLVVFLSELFPHEVLTSHVDRFSIAGWFRINGVRDNMLDISR